LDNVEVNDNDNSTATIQSDNTIKYVLRYYNNGGGGFYDSLKETLDDIES